VSPRLTLLCPSTLSIRIQVCFDMYRVIALESLCAYVAHSSFAPPLVAAAAAPLCPSAQSVPVSSTQSVQVTTTQHATSRHILTH
jgi:hypothetical protein